MIKDILFLVAVIAWAFPFFVFVNDWYIDFFKGKTMVEITHKDGRIERQFLSNKDARELIKTVKHYGTARKAERVKR